MMDTIGQDAEKLYITALEYYIGAGRDKNITLARNLLQKSAELDYVKAINLLGDLYIKKVFPSDGYKEAIALYERGCELGDMRSPYLLGRCYEKGKGVGKSIIKALEYYERSYKLGNAGVCFQVARIYEKGNGIKVDQSKAVEWYERGSELGDADCTCNLGFCYYQGNGVSKDLDKAKELFLAHSDFSSEIQKNLGVIYYKGTDTCQPDIEKAKLWFVKSAENGNVQSMIHLGRIYREEKNIGSAMAWYKKAAELDNKKGAYFYGFILYQHEKDKWDDAFKWMKMSAENEHVPAEFMLGLFYQCGVGTSVDHTKAIYWYNIAAENDYEQAYSHIGRYYLRGRFVKQNFENARYWFEKAIDSKDDNVKGEALYDYGTMYLEGLGVKKNTKKGLDYLKKSQALDCINAINKLREYEAYESKPEQGRMPSEIENISDIEDYVDISLKDGAKNEWVDNVLEKLRLYIEQAKEYGLVKQNDNGQWLWQYSSKDYAQWILDVSDDLRLFITTERQIRKYYPRYFATLFLNKFGKKFVAVDLRHNMSKINNEVGDKEVRNYKKLVDFRNKVREEIKRLKL